MRRILVIGLLTLLAAQAEAGGIPPDKLSHFAVSVPCGALATVAADQIVPKYRLVTGTVVGTVPGLIVEIVDSTHEAGFSAEDLLADLIGSAVGAVLTDQVVLRFFFDKDEKAAGVEVAGTF